MFCLQKGVQLSSILLLLSFNEAFSIPVKHEECDEGHKLKFHMQKIE